MGGYDHGLEGDDGVYEAVFFGDGVVGGVCSYDGECCFADVAVEYAVSEPVLQGLVRDEYEVPGLAVHGAGALAARLQYLVDLLLGHRGVRVSSDASAGEECVDGLHGGCRWWGGLFVWRWRGGRSCSW